MIENFIKFEKSNCPDICINTSNILTVGLNREQNEIYVYYVGTDYPLELKFKSKEDAFESYKDFVDSFVEKIPFSE